MMWSSRSQPHLVGPDPHDGQRAGPDRPGRPDLHEDVFWGHTAAPLWRWAGGVSTLGWCTRGPPGDTLHLCFGMTHLTIIQNFISIIKKSIYSRYFSVIYGVSLHAFHQRFFYWCFVLIYVVVVVVVVNKHAANSAMLTLHCFPLATMACLL